MSTIPAIVAIVVLSSALASFRPVGAQEQASAACAAEKPDTQVGTASWYGESFEGEKTASGEPFDPDAPTAAHRNLPLGTEIEVTNLENGKKAELTVTDRGPYVKKRVLDVSKKGAQELGFTEDGTARVRIEPTDTSDDKC